MRHGSFRRPDLPRALHEKHAERSDALPTLPRNGRVGTDLLRSLLDDFCQFAALGPPPAMSGAGLPAPAVGQRRS